MLPQNAIGCALLLILHWPFFGPLAYLGPMPANLSVMCGVPVMPRVHAGAISLHIPGCF